MRIDVLTLFPEVFEPSLSTSIVGRARRAGIVEIHCTDIRDFARDRHRTVDDKPFGGGPGMVLTCQPMFDAVEHVESQGGGIPSGKPIRLLLTPQGRRLDQSRVCSLARTPWLMVVCGHYEGFDERIRTGLSFEEVSIGDYVLSGGEPAAMVLIDALVRLLPGALGDDDSAVEDSFSDGLLEYPQYTRPREFRGMAVPDVLLSGNHAEVRRWREAQRRERTRARRPDLLSGLDDDPRGGAPDGA